MLKRKGISHVKINHVRYEKVSDTRKRITDFKGGISSIVQLSKDKLLDMPVETYLDPKLLSKIGLIKYRWRLVPKRWKRRRRLPMGLSGLANLSLCMRNPIF